MGAPVNLTSPSKFVKTRPQSFLIDRWLLPEARLLERHNTRFAAPPERAYQATQRVRLGDMSIVRILFFMRRIRYSKEMTLRQFFSTPPFLILDEAPPQEVVIGVVGPLGRPSEPPSTPDEFRAFTQPGMMQAIMNFRVDQTETGSLVSTETWVATFGAKASRLFRLYWLIVGPFSALIRREFLRAARKMAES